MSQSIQQNGHVLGATPTLKEVWFKAVEEYSAENWEGAIESTEEALTLFNEYQKQTKICLNKCKDTGKSLVIFIAICIIIAFIFFHSCRVEKGRAGNSRQV